MRRKKSSVRIKLLLFILFFIGVCFLLSVAENSVRPILRTMALANVEIIAGEKISEAIEEEMVSE
ncbi:MAG: hypothetical protein J6B51_07235, partial [Clostridia bacterium]|nr:hypothetical protein [Clostridia bacterium]